MGIGKMIDIDIVAISQLIYNSRRYEFLIGAEFTIEVDCIVADIQIFDIGSTHNTAGVHVLPFGDIVVKHIRFNYKVCYRLRQCEYLPRCILDGIPAHVNGIESAERAGVFDHCRPVNDIIMEFQNPVVRIQLEYISV